MLNKIFSILTLLYITLTPILLENYIFICNNIFPFILIHCGFTIIFYMLSYLSISNINNKYKQKNIELYYEKYYIIKNQILLTNLLNIILYSFSYTLYVLNKIYNYFDNSTNFILLWNIILCNFIIFNLYYYIYYEYNLYIHNINKLVLFTDVIIFITTLGVYYYFPNTKNVNIIKIYINTSFWLLLNTIIFISCKYCINYKYIIIPTSSILPLLLYFDIIDYKTFTVGYSILFLLLFIIYVILKYKSRNYYF